MESSKRKVQSVKLKFQSSNLQSSHSQSHMLLHFATLNFVLSTFPAYGREERLAQIVGLARADAFDFEQRVDGRGPKAGHLAQRGVVEDDIGGDTARARDLQPHRAQAFEEI